MHWVAALHATSNTHEKLPEQSQDTVCSATVIVRSYQLILMILLGLLPGLLLSPQLWPPIFVRKTLVHIHQKDDGDLQYSRCCQS